MFSFLLIFQIMGKGSLNHLLLISEASSKASANLLRSIDDDGLKYSGLKVNAILQMSSNANL